MPRHASSASRPGNFIWSRLAATPPQPCTQQIHGISRKLPENTGPQCSTPHFCPSLSHGCQKIPRKGTLSPHCWCTVLGRQQAATCYMCGGEHNRVGLKAAWGMCRGLKLDAVCDGRPAAALLFPPVQQQTHADQPLATALAAAALRIPHSTQRELL